MVDILSIDAEKICDTMAKWLVSTVAQKGFEKVIFGLSGGIDSATVAYLCARAFDKDNVYALSMPYKTSVKHSIEDARHVAKELGINFREIDITPMMDAYFAQFEDASRLRRGNKMARERMSILYDHSTLFNALVVGTGNKTEYFLGYTTQYGDNACAINPLGDLYKTHVRTLARYLGVPQQIIDKEPSADLWEGQTDEGELGFSYATMDKLLYYMIDEGLNRAELVRKGFDAEFVDAIRQKVVQSAFKRCLPEICSIA